MSSERAEGAKPRPSKRRRTREAALQALYQQQITGDIAKDVINQFADSDRPGTIDEEMFRELLLGIETDREPLEAKLERFCDRPLTALDPVERAAILIGAYELISRSAVPYRVAMNEAVELARRFGGQDGHKFVNAVLDKLARDVRPHEVGR